MKTTKIIFSMFALFTALVVINACSENDLELVNPNGLSPETFFKTEAQVQSAVNAVYANLQTRGLYSRHMFFSQDNMSHENDGNPQLEADKRQYLDFSFDSSHGPIADYWESCYRGINKANFVIGNEEAINAIDDAIVSSATKQKFIGEAKFLRALYNFLLVTRFGDMPLITEIPTTTEGIGKSPASEVYALIISDLQAASASLLPKSEEDNGRATKGAAIALLGKVYLFRGEHALALAEFEKLSGYALEPNYFDNFTEETEHGIESIFEIEYDDALGASAKWNSSVTGAGPNEATFRGQEYGFNDWFNVFPSDDLLDEFEPGDTRYADNFYSVGDTFAGGIVTAEMLTAGEERRAGWKKYQNYYKDANEDQESGINFKYLRYADVLLMMAECENEVGTQDDAIDYINEVRERASLDDLPYGLSKAEVFDAIVHERKVELAGEQVRFNDILRWNLAATELAGTNFQAGKNELWPIPDREISSNENVTAADQNPGY
ncbi:RagB/SusD family nutrient uptake outer membrane protein [Maribacter sp. MAR_2009_72]|uniref:RagB/SusD family nutrient uptake outer membrane protein n=1 Tax=Maribacter sp. MAR_2009_72 TaxID=1250050 RepID=UPI00119A1EE0|nr:RagB/SusD family nutrient uptake outer membrane protein [Maribacter sp. MAR_2009_72]TVZ13990.1 putative outer membrane starch-binding protein [Maribacter sp. MAR_2009_72]